MEDLVKKFINTGVGMINAATEKLQETVDEFVGAGKEPKEEGKKIVENFQAEMQKQQEELMAKGKEMMASVEGRMPEFSLENLPVIKDLMARLDAIEKKLDERENQSE
ncbi:MAG: hypothetical protein AAFY71_24235 [Bacteroidota bacterium]